MTMQSLQLATSLNLKVRLPKLAIVIPAFNEGPVIAKVINSIPKTFSGIGEIVPIVVSDGSADNTVEQAKTTHAVVVSHPINIGAGGATDTGFKAAKLIQADIVVTMDADGQHDPQDLQNLINPILDGKVEVVFGNRFIENKEMPSIRKFGNRLLSLLTRIFSGIKVEDSQCGYRAYSRQAIEKMILHERGYEICSEIIMEVGRNRLLYKEVPVKTIYKTLTHKKSQDIMNAVNIISRILKRFIWR